MLVMVSEGLVKGNFRIRKKISGGKLSKNPRSSIASLRIDCVLGAIKSLVFKLAILKAMIYSF